MQGVDARERMLIFLLRLGGTLMLSAFATIFLPVDWMRRTHEWLGLGPFPAGPLVDYLTRSIAVLYGIHGGVLLLVSRDVRRHRTIVRYFAVMNVVFGALLLGIDLHAGMPLYWTLGEGPVVLVMGLILLHLLRSVRPDPDGS